MSGGKRSSSWFIDRRESEDLTIPKIVSVRPMINPEQTDPRYRYEASIVFENGVFGRIPMGPEAETPEEANRRSRLWMGMRVSDDGYDLLVPELGGTIGSLLYRAVLTGEQTPAPGMWGPFVRFRDPPQA